MHTIAKKIGRVDSYSRCIKERMKQENIKRRKRIRNKRGK